jgi:hypothetical protein
MRDFFTVKSFLKNRYRQSKTQWATLLSITRQPAVCYVLSCKEMSVDTEFFCLIMRAIMPGECYHSVTVSYLFCDFDGLLRSDCTEFHRYLYLRRRPASHFIAQLCKKRQVENQADRGSNAEDRTSGANSPAIRGGS